MFRPSGHHCMFLQDASTKKGYSGVAIYARREPDEVRTALGWAPFDDEGRYIEARFGNLSVVSFYIPSGSSGDLRQGFKFEVMEWLKPILDRWMSQRSRLRALRRLEHRARTALDIKNWKSEPEFRLLARGNAMAQRIGGRDAGGEVRRAPLGRCLSRAAFRRVRITPGGATAARRARTMSVGALTTSSSHLGFDRARLRRCAIAARATLFRSRAIYRGLSQSRADAATPRARRWRQVPDAACASPRCWRCCCWAFQLRPADLSGGQHAGLLDARERHRAVARSAFCRGWAWPTR